MAFSEKDLRLVRKTYESKDEKSMDRIRLGNHFVDDFIFEDHQAADIPINALRVIFNIISIISNEQFRPEDRPKQLSLFDEEFETENNIFASIKIRNISRDFAKASWYRGKSKLYTIRKRPNQ
jgi:hypothetical protein